MMVESPSSQFRLLRGRVQATGPWLTFAALLLLQIASFAREYSGEQQTGHGINGMFAVPFFVGLVVLPVRQELILGASLVALLVITSSLGNNVAAVDLRQHLVARLSIVVICLWARVQCDELQHKHALLAAIFDQSPVGKALCITHSRRIVKVNRALAQLLQQDHDGLVGQKWTAFSPQQPLGGSRMIQVLQTSRGTRHADVIVTQLDAADGHPAMELIQVLDCQQQVMDQRLLVQQKCELQQALQASLRSSALVHELRQPLALLLLQIRQLQSLKVTDRNQMQALFAALQHSGDQISMTVNDIDALISSANRRAPQPLNLCNLIDAAILRWREELQQQRIGLNLRGLGLPLVVPGNQRQLLLAINNLLGNAIESLQHCNTRPRLLQVALLRRPHHAVICIADNGAGLPSNDLEELQLRSSKAGGLGLGLYIASLVATNHDGTLQAGRSPSLGGAELCLSLPLAAAPSPEANTGSAPLDAPIHRH